MADISEELITYLKTVSAVTNIVGMSTAARIWNQDGPPQGILYTTGAGPSRGAVCVVKTEDGSVDYMGGRSALCKASFTITSYAASPANRNTLGSAVWDALAPSAATQMGSTYVAEIVTVNKGIDGDYPATDASDQRIYVSQSAYSIWNYS
jgi:hypothetical protein